MSLTFTIITPCHNDADGLETTIQSINEQRNVDVEHIVVVSECSNDGSWECAQQHQNHIVILRDNGEQGPEGAYNLALEHAGGDVIGLLGCGDIYYPDALGRVGDCFKNDENIQFVTGLAAIKRQGSDKTLMVSPMCKASWEAVAFGGMIIRTESAFWSKSLMDRAGRHLSITPLSDYELWLRMLHSLPGSAIHFIKEIIATFTFHPGQRSGNPTEHFLEMRRCRDDCLQTLGLTKDYAFEQIIHWTQKVEDSLIEFSESHHQPYGYLPDHQTWYSGWPFEGREYAIPVQPDILTSILPSKLESLIQAGIQSTVLYGAGNHTKRILQSGLLEQYGIQLKGIVDDTPLPNQSISFNDKQLPIIPPHEFDKLGAESVLLSSDLYEEDLYQNAQRHNLPCIVRLYEGRFMTPRMESNSL